MWLLSTRSVTDETEELNFSFYFLLLILINTILVILNVNNHMWPVATVYIDSTSLKEHTIIKLNSVKRDES